MEIKLLQLYIVGFSLNVISIFHRFNTLRKITKYDFLKQILQLKMILYTSDMYFFSNKENVYDKYFIHT